MEQRPITRFLRQLERHLVSSILTGAGVTLLAAGLFAYVMPFGAAGTAPSTSPGSPAGSQAGSTAPASGLAAASPAPAPSAGPQSSAGASSVPASGSPGASGAVATRVVIPALRIDLPVVSGNGRFPLCDVAQYLTPGQAPFRPVQPGQPGTTYLYAHARVGMFLPLLTASQLSNGTGMIGYSVLVYTSDARVYWYSISVVKRGVVPGGPDEWTIAKAAPGVQQLVLQTSEGPNDSSTKLEVLAAFQLVQPATFAASHPTPHPQVCT